jgi:hypothetical protein
VTLHRRNAKRDANEAGLVRLARQLGATWLSLSVADGPDGILGWQGVNYLVEVKTPKGKHKPGQIEFAASWQGAPVHVVRTEEDLLHLLGVEKTRTAAR